MEDNEIIKDNLCLYCNCHNNDGSCSGNDPDNKEIALCKLNSQERANICDVEDGFEINPYFIDEEYYDHYFGYDLFV